MQFKINMKSINKPFLLECGWSKNQASARQDLSLETHRKRNLISARKIVTMRSQRGFKTRSVLDTLKRDEKTPDQSTKNANLSVIDITADKVRYRDNPEGSQPGRMGRSQSGKLIKDSEEKFRTLSDRSKSSAVFNGLGTLESRKEELQKFETQFNNQLKNSQKLAETLFDYQDCSLSSQGRSNYKKSSIQHQSRELENKLKENLKEVNRTIENEKNRKLDITSKSEGRFSDMNHKISEATRKRLFTKQIKLLSDHIRAGQTEQDNPKLMKKAKQASLEAIQRQTSDLKSLQSQSHPTTKNHSPQLQSSQNESSYQAFESLQSKVFKPRIFKKETDFKRIRPVYGESRSPSAFLTQIEEADSSGQMLTNDQNQQKGGLLCKDGGKPQQISADLISAVQNYAAQYDLPTQAAMYNTAVSEDKTDDNTEKQVSMKKLGNQKSDYNFETRAGSEQLLTTSVPDLETYNFIKNPVTSVRVQTTPALRNAATQQDNYPNNFTCQIPTRKVRNKTPHNVACKLRLKQEIKQFQNKQKQFRHFLVINVESNESEHHRSPKENLEPRQAQNTDIEHPHITAQDKNIYKNNSVNRSMQSYEAYNTIANGKDQKTQQSYNTLKIEPSFGHEQRIYSSKGPSQRPNNSSVKAVPNIKFSQTKAIDNQRSNLYLRRDATERLRKDMYEDRQGATANTMTVSNVHSTGETQPHSRPRTSVRTREGNESAGHSTSVVSNQFHTNQQRQRIKQAAQNRNDTNADTDSVIDKNSQYYSQTIRPLTGYAIRIKRANEVTGKKTKILMHNKAICRAKSTIRQRSMKEPFLMAYENQSERQVVMRNTGQQTSGRMSYQKDPITSPLDLVDYAGEYEPDVYGNQQSVQPKVSKRTQSKKKERDSHQASDHFPLTKISKSPYNTFKSQKAAKMSGQGSLWKLKSNRMQPLGLQNQPSETSLAIGVKQKSSHTNRSVAAPKGFSEKCNSTARKTHEDLKLTGESITAPSILKKSKITSQKTAQQQIGESQQQINLTTRTLFNVDISPFDSKSLGTSSKVSKHIKDLKQRNRSQTGRNQSQQRSLSRNDTYSIKQEGQMGQISTKHMESHNFIAVVEEGMIPTIYSATASRPAGAKSSNNRTLTHQQLTGATSYGSERTLRNELAAETLKITPVDVIENQLQTMLKHAVSRDDQIQENQAHTFYEPNRNQDDQQTNTASSIDGPALISAALTDKQEAPLSKNRAQVTEIPIKQSKCYNNEEYESPNRALSGLTNAKHIRRESQTTEGKSSIACEYMVANNRFDSFDIIKQQSQPDSPQGHSFDAPSKHRVGSGASRQSQEQHLERIVTDKIDSLEKERIFPQNGKLSLPSGSSASAQKQIVQILERPKVKITLGNTDQQTSPYERLSSQELVQMKSGIQVDRESKDEQQRDEDANSKNEDLIILQKYETQDAHIQSSSDHMVKSQKIKSEKKIKPKSLIQRRIQRQKSQLKPSQTINYATSSKLSTLIQEVFNKQETMRQAQINGSSRLSQGSSLQRQTSDDLGILQGSSIRMQSQPKCNLNASASFRCSEDIQQALKNFGSLGESLDSSLREQTNQKESLGQTIQVGGAQLEECKQNSQSNDSEGSSTGQLLKNAAVQKQNSSALDSSGKKQQLDRPPYFSVAINYNKNRPQTGHQRTKP